jgi:hypothetical protein
VSIHHRAPIPEGSASACRDPVRSTSRRPRGGSPVGSSPGLFRRSRHA